MEAAMKKFARDLDILLTKLHKNVDDETYEKLRSLRDRLIQLNKKKVVKINHSVMELVCAKHLVLSGYDVNVEHPLTERLICDLYGVKGLGALIVEVETGFVPPNQALSPSTYRKARIASKITRYSNNAEKFGLAVPHYYILHIPPVLARPPMDRTPEALNEIKGLCDLYYKNPPVSMDEIRNARLHTVYVLDVDRATLREIDPTTYLENKACFEGML
jgi:hypothetical protein